MENHPFLIFLGFKDKSPDIDHVERAFLDKVKERIQQVQDCYDEAEIKDTEKWLHNVHRKFFEYSLQWMARYAKTQKKTASHPDAPHLKKEARDVLGDLQKGIIEFASCYMCLNRYMTIIRDEIKKEESRGYYHAIKGTKWTSDAGTLISRYKKRKCEIRMMAERFERVRDILKTVDMNSLRKNLITLFGAEKGETLQRHLISALRVGNFKKAAAVLTEIKDSKRRFGVDKKTGELMVKQTLGQISLLIQVVSEHEQDLKAEDGKLYLRVEELNVILNTNEKETAKMNEFLAKYHLPYMQYKLDQIQHLRDKLMVFGSLESLLTLHKKLISGIVSPLPDIKTLRQFENEALERVRYLLEGHFQDVQKIRGWADEAVAEFRENRADFKEIEHVLENNDIISDQAESGS